MALLKKKNFKIFVHSFSTLWNFRYQVMSSWHALTVLLSEEKPDCSKARCEVQFSPRCPEDSILIEGYAPPGECCPLPSRCVCNPAGCLRKVCQPGYLNILVSKASGKPGECCDFYECKPGKVYSSFLSCPGQFCQSLYII